MERGFTKEVELSENDFRNYQSLGSYFKQNKKYKEKKFEKAQANFDKSTSTETKNEIAGNKLEMINDVVSDNQQSYKKKPYSYRKLISNPRNKYLTENEQECENEKVPVPFIIEKKYDEEEITAATSTDNDYDTFVRYKTLNQKADVTKGFNNMFKDYLEKDAGTCTCTLRKCAGLPKKDFDLETFLKYYTTTIGLRDMSLLSLVKYHSNRRSKEQRPRYFPWTEGSSFKSLSLDYYGLGHTGTRNKDNPEKAAETSLGKMKNDSKQNSDKREMLNPKLGNIPHRRVVNSLKEGVLWQQTNNPFFR